MQVGSVLMYVYAAVGTYTVYRCVRRINNVKNQSLMHYTDIKCTGKATMTVDEIALNVWQEQYGNTLVGCLSRLLSKKSQQAIARSRIFK